MFYVPIEDIAEGRKILDTLARYDLFQLENKIKPDYSNTGGLQVFDDGEWIDWYDDDGNDIDSTALVQSTMWG